jgi:hypothetical protein
MPPIRTLKTGERLLQISWYFTKVPSLPNVFHFFVVVVVTGVGT